MKAMITSDKLTVRWKGYNKLGNAFEDCTGTLLHIIDVPTNGEQVFVINWRTRRIERIRLTDVEVVGWKSKIHQPD